MGRPCRHGTHLDARKRGDPGHARPRCRSGHHTAHRSLRAKVWLPEVKTGRREHGSPLVRAFLLPPILLCIVSFYKSIFEL